VQPKLSGHHKLTASWMCTARDHPANGSWPCDTTIRTLAPILEPISYCNLETCYTEGHCMAAMIVFAPALAYSQLTLRDLSAICIMCMTVCLCTSEPLQDLYYMLWKGDTRAVVGLLAAPHLLFLLQSLRTRSSGPFQFSTNFLNRQPITYIMAQKIEPLQEYTEVQKLPK
jgi:hypothetical protein